MLNFYLYSVTSISLALFYVGFLVFVRGAVLLIFRTDTGEEAIRIIANGIGYTAVSFPLWWVHWDWLRQQYKKSRSDADLGYQFYLFTVVCINAMIMLFVGGVGVSRLLKYLFGAGDTSPTGLAGSVVLMVALLLSLAMWRHHWRQFNINFGDNFSLGNKTPNVSNQAAH